MKWLLIPGLLLVGCGSRAMTNDEIIEETKKCNDAGMTTQRYVDGFDMETTRIECVERGNDY